MNIPDAREIINDQLIDTIIQNGRWTEHGEYIDNFFRDHSMSVRELSYNTKFDIMKKWLLGRADYVNENMLDQDGNKLNEFSIIERHVICDKVNLNNIGIFWAVAGYAEPHLSPNDGKYYIFRTHLGNVNINWRETFLSRFDYDLGDEENEIQLISGSNIDRLSLSVDYGKEQILTNCIA